MKAWLILADGTIFEGTSIGAQGKTIGETVFTTGMTGYIETITDPSYFGQIVTQTFPLMGNYGIIPEDYESKKCWVRGYIVREICDLPSNFRCQGTLNDFLKTQNIVGICGIDTRALTKRLRESGVMNGMIISGDIAPAVTSKLLHKIREYKIEQAVETVSTKEGEASPSVQPAAQSSPTPSAGDTPATPPTLHPHIILWDFGAKANIQRELEKRGCRVTVVPCETTADQILAMNPDGLMLSNGPGDPADNVGIIQEITKICEYNKRQLAGPSTGSGTAFCSGTAFGSGTVVIFGICLGHQMLALARGCKTSKLKYGHRGGNHPVKDTATGRVYITSQNHGYAVESDTLPDFASLSFYNVNDETCEGITYKDIPAFSVQFHPEACGGPHDTNFLFDNFIAKIKEVKNASK